MAIREKITELEKEAIMKYVHWYAHDGISTLNTVLPYWERNKVDLFKMLGNQLIVSKEIQFKLGIEELTEEIDRKIYGYNSEASTFVQAFQRLTSYGGLYQHNYQLSSLLHPETLASNIYDYESFEITLPNGKPFSINSGCKVSRILGKLAAALDLPGYEPFRLLHSQALNQKILKGTLCLSIHPLDFMTMSDNECGWSSCMSWSGEGEYRRGTVEMMNSPYVVVAYLTAEYPYPIGSLSWSNKKWRELFIVTRDIITGVKPYPYYNEYIEKVACDTLRDLAVQNLGWNYFDEMVKYCHNTHFDFLGESFKVHFETDTMYNDFGSCGHIGYIGVQAPTYICYNYSGESHCLFCGENTDYFDYEGSLICCECDDTCRCYECGDRYNKSGMYELDGELYCEYCYNNIACNCHTCNAVHHSNNIYEIHAAHFNAEKGQYEIFLEHNAYVCDDCFYYLKRPSNEQPAWIKELFNDSLQMHSHKQYWSSYYFVDINSLTEKGLELFNITDPNDMSQHDGDVFITTDFI